MNGLCEQCQLYYPMPPDFAEGVPYACPECGGPLVPWEGLEAEPPDAGAEPPDVEAAADPEPPEAGEDAWADLVPDALPESPGGAIPTVRFPADEEAPDETEEPVPADRARDDILAALSEMTGGAAEEDADEDTDAAAIPEAPEASPATPTDEAPTRFVHKGAGEGVAREALPDLPIAPEPEPEPRAAPPSGQAGALARPSARRDGPRRPPLGLLALGLVLVGLLGAAAAAWWFGVPWLGLAPGGPGAGAMPAAAEAARPQPTPEPEATPEDPEAEAPTGRVGHASRKAQAQGDADERAQSDRALERVRAGNALLKEGRVDPAIQAFEQALLHDARFGYAHRGLAIAYARLGRAAEAAREYELYLQLVPDAPEADEVRRIVDAYYATRAP